MPQTVTVELLPATETRSREAGIGAQIRKQHRPRKAIREELTAVFGRAPIWRRFRPRQSVRHIARYERVLGSSLDLQIVGADRDSCIAAESAALAEIDRLEAIFNAYRLDSELSLWQRTAGYAVPVSPELAQVLHAAEFWRQRTGNAFHPAVEALTRIWQAASERGIEPSPGTLADIVEELRSPLWDVDLAASTATRHTRLPVTLNAIAKGFILDRACEAAIHCPGIRAALVNIGGDIRQIGGKGAPVGIADPFAPYENAPLLDTVALRDQGIATSGNYRRGFQVGDRWYSHLLDPRTGYPVEHVVSASVFTDSAMLSDILATAISVIDPAHGLLLADDEPNVGVLIVARAGERRANAAWRRHAV